MNTIGTIGYSTRSRKSDFLHFMKKQQIKNFKMTCTVTPILFIILSFISVVMSRYRNHEIAIAIFAILVIAVILLTIVIVMGVNTFFNIQRLKKEPIDCEVAQNRKIRTYGARNRKMSEYRIILKTDEGKKIVVKNAKAMPFYSLLEPGELVRYHPGFVYPIEIYDKSKIGKNVCVFCGKTNVPDADICSNCGNLMLRSGS